jgi:hypothetical protein
MKKSKLQLKLEGLQKAKEEADAAKEEAGRIAAELEAEKRVQMENDKISLAVHKESEVVKGEDHEGGAEEDDEEEDGEAVNSNSNSHGNADEYAPSTMFGDEVVHEYAVGGGLAAADIAIEMLASGKKLSNKDKRRLMKESEAKDRQDEYNKAAMKASIEGAQFAVHSLNSLLNMVYFSVIMPYI